MSKSVLILVLAILLAGGSARAAERIVIAGTGDSQKLLRLLAKGYADGHPGAVIEVPDSIGSGGGIRAAASGACDLGRVARPLKEGEARFGLSYRVFALSPVAFLVNPSVQGVGNLTSAQVVGIYAGRLTNWREVGGADAKIYVASREAGDSSRSILEKELAGFKEIAEPVGETLFSTPETIETIVRYPLTIGYGPLSMANGTDLRVLKLDGVAPTPENAHSGRYPHLVPLGLVWKGELKGLAKAFMDYLFSPAGQQVITSHGAVPAQDPGK